MKALRAWLCTAGLALAPLLSCAAPMGFKDSQMAMLDMGTNWRDVSVNHAFSARDALGAGALWMRSDDRKSVLELTEVNVTRLLARWNEEHSQGNLWFVGGVGTVRDARGNQFSGSRTLWAPGVQADFETTRVYLSANARLYRAAGVRRDYAALRAGFSFFEAEYEETQPWLVLEVRRMRGLSQSPEVTPMLRLINKGWFVEAGVNRQGQGRANAMYIF